MNTERLIVTVYLHNISSPLRTIITAVMTLALGAGIVRVRD
jgi:hypothetical protein